jgi:hypothetical protein
LQREGTFPVWQNRKPRSESTTLKITDSIALGFRAHSGWAAAIVLAGPVTSPQIIDRRRIELVEPGTPGGVQPYHAARELPLVQAGPFIQSVIAAADQAALLAVRFLAKQMGELHLKIKACGIVLASGRPLPSLEVTLRSHPMVHTAEGELYRAAIANAAKRCGWPCLRIPERELYQRASEEFRIPETSLKNRVTEMGQSVGSPWSADEKCATLVAWLALRGAKS